LNENWQGKPKYSLCPSLMPHDLNCYRTKATVMGSLSYGTAPTGVTGSTEWKALRFHYERALCTDGRSINSSRAAWSSNAEWLHTKL
jgi:hypothetical protein